MRRRLYFARISHGFRLANPPSILGKLDLTSRTRAALWAVRQGLVKVGAE